MDLRQKVPFFMNYTSGYFDTVTGNGSVALPKAKANGLKSVKLFGGCEQSGTPTPTTPVDIVCNNGVLTFGATTTYNTADGQGTFVTPSQTVTTRIYKSFGKLKAGKYKVKITSDFEFIFQFKDTLDVNPTQYGNIGTWATEGEYDITDENMYYGVAIRNGSGSGNIYPSNFNNIGSIGYSYLGIMPVGTTETVELKKSGTVGYTVVGSPTILDGVVSGFSGSNYLSLPATLDISQNFEWVFCITTDDLSTEQRIFAYNTGTINSVYIQNKYLKWWITGDSSNILSTDDLNPNTRYFIKCSNVNGLYSLSYSTDGITYTGLRTKELSLSTTVSSYYDIGVNHTSYYSPFLGSIDLNETYIKVNGELWFGMETIPNNTATAEMLLAAGEYKDTQEVISGTVTRNLRLIVLDGTESWSKRTDSGVNRYQANILTNKASGAIPCLCSHFQNVISFASLNDNCFIADATSRIIFDEEDITTLADWKAWLVSQYANGTPVIVIYPLATPTAETVTPQTLQVQAGTNILQITQASIDNLPLEATYKRGK